MLNKQNFNKLAGGGGADCLNLVRLLAALQVMYGHTLAHLHIEGIPVLGDFINFFHGVPIFFTMSGFLIWGSIGRSKNFSEYAMKRFWRIFPELWVAVAIELVVLLLLFHSPVNWLQVGCFAITQSTIFQFWTPDCLRAYGCGCPNGSLWTVCVLIQFYFVAFFVYKYMHGRKVWIWLAAIAAAVCASLASPSLQAAMPETAGKLFSQTLVPYFWMFLVASFFAERKDSVLPVLKKYWPLILIVLLAVRHWHCDINAAYGVADTVLLFACITGAAYCFPMLNVKTDISYAVYIYHMTVVNALIQLHFAENRWLVIVVFATTCALAWLSTKTVGEAAQRMKKKHIV